MVQKHVKISKLVKAFDFEVVYSGIDNLERKILLPTVHRVGAELTGFLVPGDELNKQLHVLGSEEMRYVDSLTSIDRKKRLKNYFSYNFPCIVVACEEEIHPDFIKYAVEHNKPLLTTKNKSAAIIRKLKYYLQRKLSPEIRLEGYTLIEISGVGVLISGYEDARIGTALELIERGNKYITDENLIVKKIGTGTLLGENGFDKSSTNTHFFIWSGSENIDITNNYGIVSTRNSKEINLFINLEKWDKKKFYDRLGIDRVYETFLGVDIPKLSIPVRKGRNLATIIETAAINERLKQIGLNSSEYFLEETKKLIAYNKSMNKGDKMKMKNLTVKQIVEEFDLKVVTGEDLLETTYVKKTTLHNPALALSGFYEVFHEIGAESVQLFSQGELNFLNSLDAQVRNENLGNFFNFDFPAMIIADAEEIQPCFIQLSREKNKIMLLSDKSSTQLTADLNQFLEKKFAQKITMHGVFVEMFGFGVLLTGKSGIGKSETALELIHRGHRLITDDKVTFYEDPSGIAVGKADKIPYFMELRGIGIIDIKALYGLGSVRKEKRLDAIIELKELKNDDYLTKKTSNGVEVEVLGHVVNHAELYISSGRNAATMIETTIMNLIAKKYGYDPKKAYKGRIRHAEFT
ncbi:MAG: HPr(Ser) kinase/phosphatase [Psychrilyobacter sp.]|nr:HPr(Ser) kinase/phosphatase [Psychrilyobacter sp.]